MDVRYEADGPVALITIDRPQTRNAIDGEVAGLLAEAFEQFDADPQLSVAVLFGDGGHFCAGADITKLDNPLDPEGIGPLGPTRMMLHKPVIAAIEGSPSPAVSSWPCGATCGWRARRRRSASTPVAGGSR